MNAMNPQPAAFDTLASFTELKDAGIDEKHAKALVSVFSRTANMPDISQLATKADLENISTRMATREDLANARAEIIRWLFGGIAILILTTTIEHFLK